MKLEIQILDHGSSLPVPKYQTEGSAGMDLMAAIEDDIIIAPKGGIGLIPTGISIALEQGLEAQVRPRSGLALKNKVTVLNTPGTIDSDYRGEIKVILINHGEEEFIVTSGMRIAQMVISKYEQVKITQVEKLTETARGEMGFGSTGTS